MSHHDITMDKVQRKVSKLQLEHGWPRYKYLYTVTCDHVYMIGSRTKDIEQDTEEAAIDTYLDNMEEEIREDRSICIDDISRTFKNVLRSVQITQVREIEWIDPRQLELIPGI